MNRPNGYILTLAHGAADRCHTWPCQGHVQWM